MYFRYSSRVGNLPRMAATAASSAEPRKTLAPLPRRLGKLRVEVEVAAGVVRVGYVGSDAAIAEVVRCLVASGVGVVGVEPERNELERIFLEVTRGEVQ